MSDNPKAAEEQETEKEKMHFRSVWISDVHLGTKHAQVDQLLAFLRDCECRYLYIVGDFIDGWQLRSKWYWEDSYNVLIQKLLRKSRKKTRVIYITGNHDEFVDQFANVRFGSVTFAQQAIHTSVDGRRYLVIHGHQCDGIAHFNRLLDRIGTRLYDWILDFNLHFNRVRRLLGFGYWSVAAYLKYKAKSAVKYVSDYEESLAQMARKQNADGVICGHIHRAEIREIHGVRYLNCGDWVESCTALVEDFDGSIRLLHLHDENNVLHSRRGARAHDAGHGDEGDARNGGTPGDRRGGGLEPGEAVAGILHVGHEDAADHRADPGVCI
jgi:UDP-2,3-diacylglucosamine pyrophosphatase LpxH